MNQLSIEGNVKYYLDFISFRMEDDESYSQGPGESPSKPKKSVVKNEANSFSGDGAESIGIGYPIDEDKFKELKRGSKAKMEEGDDDDSRQYEDLSNKDENQ